MRNLFRICLLISAIATAAPALAQLGKFNGTYVGVSTTKVGGSYRCGAFHQKPGPLTIVNGSARSQNGYFEGNVDSAGHVVLHSKMADRFEGQIDANGKLTVSGNSPHCTFAFVWQRQ